MKKISVYIHALLLVIGLYSCANVLPLTGGEKDSAPPKVKSTTPADKSLQTRTRKISIEFDEFVVLKDPSKKILISPPGTKFETVEKGKSIELTITDTLKPNTTYVINFGGSVADNNEGNVLNDLVFVFSTGDQVDSLKTSYTVLDAFTLKPVEGVKVMLYDQDIDSLPLKSIPYYAGTTDASGGAVIEYMKPGKFKVFALKEENNTYTYDNPEESIGFIDSLSSSGDSLPAKIFFFKEPVKNAKIRTARIPAPGLVSFKFSGPVDKKQLRLLNTFYSFDSTRFEFVGEKKDSALYWYKPINKTDTLIFQFTRNLGETDTLKVYPRGLSAASSRNKKPTKPTTALKILNTVPAEFDHYKPLVLEFSAPVDSMDMDTMRFREDLKFLPVKLVRADSIGRKYTLDYVFKQGKTYTLSIPKNAVKDMLGQYIDSASFTFKTTTDKSYKDLHLTIKNPQFTGSAIIQLLDGEDRVLDEKRITWGDNNKTTFNKLKTGTYRVRLIYDTNNNGAWDTGNYKEKRQPEKVVFFPQNIEIKPSFDMEMDWDIMAPVGIGTSRGGEDKKEE